MANAKYSAGSELSGHGQEVTAGSVCPESVMYNIEILEVIEDEETGDISYRVRIEKYKGNCEKLPGELKVVSQFELELLIQGM